MAIFFRTSFVLFHHAFIFDCVICCLLGCKSAVEILDDLSDCGIDFLIREDFLDCIYQKDVEVSFESYQMLLASPAFADASLEEVALYRSLEEFLGYRDYDTVDTGICTISAHIAHSWYIAVLTFGKKHRDGRLAAQSFFLRKSITNLSFHY